MTNKTVYFLQPESGGSIKIGCSKNADLRLQTLSSWSPSPLKMLAKAPGGHAAERSIHKRFSNLRGHGEWFTDSDDLREYIKAVSATGRLDCMDSVVVNFEDPEQCGTGHPVRLLNKLGQYMKCNGLTAREFGLMVGASEHTVGKWSRGERMPRPEAMRAIAKITNGAVTANDFVGEVAL